MCKVEDKKSTVVSLALIFVVMIRCALSFIYLQVDFDDPKLTLSDSDMTPMPALGDFLLYIYICF